MAIPGGYRFKIPFDDLFPQGCSVFEDMTAVPSVRDGWIASTLWAKAMRSALPADQGGKPAAKAAAA